jgi:hypothetical protein
MYIKHNWSVVAAYVKRDAVSVLHMKLCAIFVAYVKLAVKLLVHNCESVLCRVASCYVQSFTGDCVITVIYLRWHYLVSASLAQA